MHSYTHYAGTLSKLEFHRTTNSVPLNEEKQMLKMIGDLEKKKRALQEWEEREKQIKEAKVRREIGAGVSFLGKQSLGSQ